MQVDIGAKRPIEGDDVYKIGRLGGTAQSFASLHDEASGRKYERILKSISAEALVQQLGENHFVRFEHPEWGVVWFRRSTIRGVYEVPAPVAEQLRAGSLLQMVFDEPMPDPWPPKRRFQPAYSFYFEGMSVADVESALGL